MNNSISDPHTDLVIKFSNKKAREHFMQWLDGQGEQDYWTWMECRQDEEEGDITARKITYDLKNGIITTECGRV